MIATPPEVKPTSRYSVGETAKLLGLSQRTISRYISAGNMKVQYLKINKRPVISGLEITRIWNSTL